MPEIQSGNLFEACLISETVQVTTGNFGPFRNGRIGVSVKWRCECEMTKFRQLPNLGSSFSHCSRCEFTGNGRDPYLVGLEGCQIWAPFAGGNLGLGRISSKSILNLGARGQSRVTSAAGVPSRMDGLRNVPTDLIRVMTYNWFGVRTAV